jgi:hypothetical protein
LEITIILIAISYLFSSYADDFKINKDTVFNLLCAGKAMCSMPFETKITLPTYLSTI